MKKIVLAFALCLSATCAFALQGMRPSEMCNHFPMVDQTNCIRTVSQANFIDPEAAYFCAQIITPVEQMSCLRAISGKSFNGMLDACANVSPVDMLSCIRGAGREGGRMVRDSRRTHFNGEKVHKGEFKNDFPLDEGFGGAGNGAFEDDTFGAGDGGLSLSGGNNRLQLKQSIREAMQLIKQGNSRRAYQILGELYQGL